MLKFIRWIVVIVLLVLILAAAAFLAGGGTLIKNAVNQAGPAILGVPVTLEQAHFKPLAGKIKLTGLHIGNPEGFKTPALFELGEAEVDIGMRSLLSDTIVIQKIRVIAPHITYEKGLLDSNFSVLLKKLEGEDKEKTEPAREPTAPKKEKASTGKKVVIDEFIVSDPTLNFSLTAAGGKALPIKLGNVELKNVGREQGGVTAAEIVKIIFSAMAANVENAVKGAGSLAVTSGQAVGGSIKAASSGAVDKASTVLKGFSGLLRGSRTNNTADNQ